MEPCVTEFGGACSVGPNAKRTLFSASRRGFAVEQYGREDPGNEIRFEKLKREGEWAVAVLGFHVQKKWESMQCDHALRMSARRITNSGRSKRHIGTSMNG